MIVLNTPESSPGATDQVASTITGGHASAHVPVHVDLASVSLVKAYSVLPDASTRICPYALEPALTATVAPAGGAGAAVVTVGAGGTVAGGAFVAAAPLHAATPNAANARNGRIRLFTGGSP
jgi:hypothetical protein